MHKMNTKLFLVVRLVVQERLEYRKYNPLGLHENNLLRHPPLISRASAYLALDAANSALAVRSFNKMLS